jgi:hypothetical protein
MNGKIGRGLLPFVLVAAGLTSVLVLLAEEGRGARDAYVLRRGTSLSLSGSLDDLGTLAERYPGDFLWFRRRGAPYVIREPRLMNEAASLFEPIRALEPAQESIANREAALDREEEDNEAEQERLEAEVEERESEPSDDQERRLRELANRQRDIARRQRELAREERALDRKEKALEEAAEQQLWKLLDRSITDGAARTAT